MAGLEPEAAIVNGFFQCLDLKPDLKAASMDFDADAKVDEHMAREILRREAMLPTSRDKQFRQHKGKWLVSRLLPDHRLIDDFARSDGSDMSTVEVPLKELGPVQVATTDAGRLSALVFQPDDSILGPLPPGYVEIQVKAVGMNMVGLSALTGGYDTDDLSSEFSGVVTATAPDVAGLSVNDSVFAMWPGKFGNIVRCPALAVAKALPKDSFEALATLPSAYATAWYALVTAASIQSGDKVLVQSATGGFGMAAIAVARMHGAEIFATAGSPAKRAMLTESLGIAEDHVFSSRELSAKSSLLEASGGSGFDIVLNTSSGDYLRQVSWPLVAPFGRFVELKKVDIVDNGTLSLKKFNDGVSFIAVDMHHVCAKRPGTLAQLMRTVGNLYRAGTIATLPVTSFPVSRIGEAYGAFSRFEHTGKLVLSYDAGDAVPYLPLPARPQFRAAATYLIVGGVSGIGAYLARWMVQQGVRHLVVLTRSALNDEGLQNVAGLRALGCTVTHIRGSVSDRADVRRALTVPGLPPVRGIVNSALVLRNKEFDRLTCAEAHETFAPKIAGNKVLHEVSHAELGLALDFFVLLSSLTSICHAATQASYSAANCFMDEFARFRHRQGLACTSISLGVIGDVGFMGRNQQNMMHLIRNGHYVTMGNDLVRLFATALFRPAPTPHDVGDDDEGEHTYTDADLVALGTEPTKLRELLDTGSVPVPLWERDIRWSIIGVHALRSGRGARGGLGGAGGASDVKGEVKDLVADRLSRLLWVPLDKVAMDSSLSSMGIDSMIASEFRHWMYQTFRVNVSMMELLAQDMTIEKLSELLERGNVAQN